MGLGIGRSLPLKTMRNKAPNRVRKAKELVCLHKMEGDHMLTWYVPTSKPAIDNEQIRQIGLDKNYF